MCSSSGTASSPMRRALCLSRSLNLVCKILILFLGLSKTNTIGLVGLLSHLDRKNAEKIAAFVDVERLVIQAFIGTAPWDHRPLIKVLVGQVVEQLGEPDGVIAFDPSS